MLVLCLLSIIIIAAILFYALCAVSSRVSRHFENRDLVFLTPSAAAPFEDLLAAGDEESVYRIMKALVGRGELYIIEAEKQILIAATDPPSAKTLREITVD
jgi:hypothetical protein